MAVQIPTAIAINLLAGAERRGVDPVALLSRAGLGNTPRDLTVPEFVKLVRTVTLTLDDELAGLHHRPQRIGWTAIMASYVSQAATLGEGYERAVQFMDLGDNSFRYSLRSSGSNVMFEMTRIPGRVVQNEVAIEMILMLVNRMMAWLAGNLGTINRAWFDYPAPPHAYKYRSMFLRAPLLFDQTNSGLALPATLMKLPLIRTEEQAIAYARRTPLDAFLPMDSTSGLSLEVSVIVDSVLSSEGRLVDMDEVGRALAMPSHTLRRRLKKEGVDYSDIRKQVRRDLAVRLLATSDVSVEEIANQTGFSEASAFIRAFRSWTGMTPRAYRSSDAVR
ncbi:HTH-type transcriptional regulator VirS [Falsiruegeria litorea R37]|uniref:HTH-type transcriptional regulator VirS n=1 Tax=Falsiruegeria litorea R37 TaxID=1200284 RepID=A0A1Y5TQV2_9RHOB|nr:AraC family transcriptional regulator [Falsiruegeria litorea]SLN67947.1 HTH-type transcriptional regulator VirS [Falsiruegeria litorea R37]